jgi:hypothetical protein
VDKVLLLSAAIAVCVCGMAWFALSLDSHWRQVRSGSPSLGLVRQLRLLGWVSMVTSLVLCLAADHASMASLVWVMTVAASALIVAFTLTWRPSLLNTLIAWAEKS